MQNLPHSFAVQYIRRAGANVEESEKFLCPVCVFCAAALPGVVQLLRRRESAKNSLAVLALPSVAAMGLPLLS